VGVAGFTVGRLDAGVCAGGRCCVAPLTDTRTRSVGVDVFVSASEVYFARLPRCGDVTADQVDVYAFYPGGIIRVILDMGSMAIQTLDILAGGVVVRLPRVAVGADIDVIRHPGGNCCPPRVGAQQVAVAAADNLEAGNIIGTPRIGRMYPVAG